MSNAAPRREETIRVHQANERTLLAWIRTGIALMAFGFAIARFGVFLRQIAAVNATASHVAHAPGAGLESTWVGTVLVGLGTLINALGTVRYAQVRRDIERGDVGPPSVGLVYAMGAVATLVGIAMAVLLSRSIGE